jgi:hypothetical protein
MGSSTFEALTPWILIILVKTKATPQQQATHINLTRNNLTRNEYLVKSTCAAIQALKGGAGG